MTITAEQVKERFWAKVRLGTDTECWEWLAGRSDSGYGSFHVPGVGTRSAHRIAYEFAKGPIPEGLTIDHLCRNRPCVNPRHLEAVERGENVKRGMGVTASNARKTHCKYGHEFTDANIYRRPEGRVCRECKRLSQRKDWASTRSSLVAPVMP